MAVNDKRSFVDGKPAEVEPEPESLPTLALVDAAPPNTSEVPTAHDLQLSAAEILAAAGKEGLAASLAVGAADMLNRFNAVDSDWMLQVIGSPIPASEKIIEAADAGELPFRLQPTRDGRRLTSLVGMFNALLTHLGCTGRIDVLYRVDRKTRMPVKLEGFEAVFPDDETEGEDE